jgi:Flp pilus assembly protein TadD
MVVGGNQSTDEMAHLWFQVLPRGEADQRMVLQEAIMQHRLEKYPADFSALFNLGALRLNRKQIPSAIAFLRSALRSQPGQPVALNSLGVALESDNQLAEAVEQFRHALRVQPDYTDARYNLANALALQGDLSAAAANFRQVLSAVPNDIPSREHLVDALTRLATSTFSSGQLEAAGTYLRELVQLEPGNADLRNNFGIVLVRTGEIASAIEQFRAALRADPAHQAARRNLDLARKKLQ